MAGQSAASIGGAVTETVVIATVAGRRIVAGGANGGAEIVALLPAPCHPIAFLHRAEKRDGQGFGHRRVINMALQENLAGFLGDGFPKRADLNANPDFKVRLSGAEVLAAARSAR